MTKPNGKPCARCGTAPKVGRYLCANCLGKCAGCGVPVGKGTNGYFHTECPACRKISETRSTCSKCGADRDGSHRSYCGECYRQYKRAWSRANPEKVAAKERKAHLRQYGLTVEGWESMLASQGGGCAVCGSLTTRGRGRFHVDHDHVSGLVRGILCQGCNVAIAQAGDSAQRLRMLADYLER